MSAEDIQHAFAGILPLVHTLLEHAEGKEGADDYTQQRHKEYDMNKSVKQISEQLKQCRILLSSLPGVEQRYITVNAFVYGVMCNVDSRQLAFFMHSCLFFI